MLDPEIAKPMEVSILRQEGADAVFPADCHDLGIEGYVARGARPGFCPLRQCAQASQRPRVLWRLLTVSIYQDVRVNRDHRRPSSRSYSASRSAASTSGGYVPRRVTHSSR